MAAMTYEEREKAFKEYAQQQLVGWTEDNEDGLTYDEYQDGILDGIYSIDKYTNKDGDKVVELCVGWGGPYVFLDFVFNAEPGMDYPYWESNLKYVKLRSNVIDYAYQPGAGGGMQTYKYTLNESKFLWEEYAAIFDSDILDDEDEEEAVNG